MCKPAQLPDRCGIGSWRETQIVKLKRGSDPSTGLGADNRMYYEPSAQRRIRFYWTRIGGISVVRVPLLPESSEWPTGIVFEDRGKRDILNCGDGDIAACSSLDQGSPESKSLFCAILRDVIISSHTVNARVQEITAMEGGWQLRRPAERTLLITAAFLHCASLRDCKQDVGRTHVDKGMAYSFRPRSPLFAQGRGAEFLGGMSGIADIPKGRGPYPGRTASDPGSANSTSTTDYVSPAQPHSLSYPRKRRSCPACSPLESSHPFARLQPTTAYLYLPTMIPCHRALVFGSVAPPSKFYCIKGCMPMEA